MTQADEINPPKIMDKLYVVTVQIKVMAPDPMRAIIIADSEHGEIFGLHADLAEVATE